jgi:nucleotide-binding universal stress UspA family protein
MSAARSGPLTPSVEVTFKNILVTTDFSACSEAAVKMAAALARHHQSQLILLHTIPAEPMLETPMQPNTWDYEHVREHSDRAMEDLRNSPVLAGLTVKTLSGVGYVLKVTRRLAAEEKVDLVVLGTHGRTGFKKLFMGSVAEEVERLLCGPVLTIGPSVEADLLECGQFRSILYATDFSGGSEHALRYALSFARESGARLHLLHVIVEEMVTAFYLHDEIERNCKQRLARLVPPGLLPSEPEIIVEMGVPAEAIVKQAMLTAADLIVMGIHQAGLRGAQASAHIPWSVANAVVAHAPCPVLTVCGKPS